MDTHRVNRTQHVLTIESERKKEHKLALWCKLWARAGVFLVRHENTMQNNMNGLHVSPAKWTHPHAHTHTPTFKHRANYPLGSI